jgi:hypothetical protein
MQVGRWLTAVTFHPFLCIYVLLFFVQFPETLCIGDSIKFLLDQQASRYVRARLKSTSIIHTMVDELEFSEKHYVAKDFHRYVGCIEYYIRTAAYLETQSNMQSAIFDEIRNAQVLIDWNPATDQKQKLRDHLNIMLEYQRNMDDDEEEEVNVNNRKNDELGTTSSSTSRGTKNRRQKETIKRVKTVNGEIKLIAPEGRIYKLDLLVGIYMKFRRESKKALRQAKIIISMMEKKSYSREKAKYYIDIMNSLENHGIQHVQQIHDALNEMDYDDDDHVDDDHVTNGNILMDRKYLNKLLSKENIIRTFLSCEEWKKFKDPNTLLTTLTKDRWSVAEDHDRRGYVFVSLLYFLAVGLIVFGSLRMLKYWKCLKSIKRGKFVKRVHVKKRS